MWRKPKDVEGECNAWLCLDSIIKCELPEGHSGPHKYTYTKISKNHAELTWIEDESHMCPIHGKVEFYGHLFPCLACWDHLPDCPTCKGFGHREDVPDIVCDACNGEGKIIGGYNGI
jgi:hypothetical protein